MTLRYLIDTDWVIDHLNQIDRVVKMNGREWGMDRTGSNLLSYQPLS
jgi:hypothetical protein